ncbi:NUDIX domain-containing protein [Neptuniibacter sp. QD37_11]|uniref:NUDIX domain-containing protein n=1 Tax=Neptuniibacter sp. QD37_11 TaxID=3398209 RepID=UPI0039F5C80D
MKTAVFAGRFSPIQIGHMSVYSYIQDNYDRAIILVGSVNRCLSDKNPFRFTDRERWIQEAFSSMAKAKGMVTWSSDQLTIIPVNDYVYDDPRWESETAKLVESVVSTRDQISLVGYEKDTSSFYLRRFPQWQLDLRPLEININATDIRNAWFENGMQGLGDMASMVPDFVRKDLVDNPILKREGPYSDFLFYQDEAKRFANYPYPETLQFNTADLMAVCDDNLLLIRRKNAPGKGCWALPGGFVDSGESFRMAALREVGEEASLDKEIPFQILGEQMFDKREPTSGIPRKTQVTCIEVQRDAQGNLPLVIPADDADAAQWFSIKEVKEMALFSDHSGLINKLLNQINEELNIAA